MKTKVEIRKEITKERASLSYALKSTYDKKIIDACLSQAYIRNSKRILAFYPMNFEPQIQLLLEEFLIQGKNLFLPKINGDNLDIYRVDTLKELSQNELSVFEPNNSHEIENNLNFDLILIPGLAFTKNGDRIGYGQGFYDRLLSKCNGVKCALAYEFQYNIDFQAEEHDKIMDLLITNQNIYRFN